MGSSVSGSRGARWQPVWRKGMTMTIGAVSTIILVVCKKLTPLVTTSENGWIGKSNGIFAPVSLGAHPRSPAAWTLHRLCLQLPAPAGQHAGSVWGAAPGAPGRGPGHGLGVADRGGTTAHGSAQVQHTRRRWDDATGRGLSRIRGVLGDPGPGQSEEE